MLCYVSHELKVIALKSESLAQVSGGGPRSGPRLRLLHEGAGVRQVDLCGQHWVLHFLKIVGDGRGLSVGSGERRRLSRATLVLLEHLDARCVAAEELPPHS